MKKMKGAGTGRLVPKITKKKATGGRMSSAGNHAGVKKGTSSFCMSK